jgi:hypothetical protein
MLPAWPGRWVMDGYHALRLPTRHLAWYVTRQPTRGGGFYLDAIVQPQFVWSDVLDGTLGRRLAYPDRASGHYVNAEATEAIDRDPAATMPPLRELVLADGLPHLETVGSGLLGYLRALDEFAASRPTGLGTSHTETYAAGAHLLRRDLPAARESYRRVLASAVAVPGPHPDWLRERTETAEERLDLSDNELSAVRDDMLRVEDRMRERWHLPAPEADDVEAGCD